MLSVIMPSVNKQIVFMLSVVTLNVIIMLSVIMLNVERMSVVAPLQDIKGWYSQNLIIL